VHPYRSRCGSDNDLRINTYTPWATAVLSLQKTCQAAPPPPPPSGTPPAPAPPLTGFALLQADGCADLLLKAPTFPALLALVRLVQLASIYAPI
jgi:hypothetical protein